jgi:hypothetical protein
MRSWKKSPAIGQVRWVHFESYRRREHDFETEPKDLPTLRVEIIAVENDAVTEQTMTNFPFLPDAAERAGWVMAAPAEKSGSTRWVRRRQVKPERRA